MGRSRHLVAATIVLLSALRPAPLPAQRRIVPVGSAEVVGTVWAEDPGTPIPSISVALLFAGDSVMVAATVTGAEGRFRLTGVPEGIFRVRLTSLGYGTVFTEPFEVAEAEVRNLGRLVMPVEAVEVAPITVSAERTVVTYEADRTSYNVGVMPGTEGASVTETLATIPDLEVDIDGRVTLRSQSVAIYVNGRPAPMSGESLSVFLEQFPADYLQKIEIIDNPSARYDAEGGGGIVNLVMKEGVELGLSGTVFANAGTRGQYGVGGRGTLQRGDWTVDGGGFVRLSDSESRSYDLRQNLFVDPVFLRRDSRSDRTGVSSNADLEMRYEPGERTQIRLEGRVSGSGSESAGLTTTTHLSDLESPILAYDRARVSDSRDVAFDVASAFEYRWEPRGHEVEVEVELERDTGWEDLREEITEGAEPGEGRLLPAELTLEDQDELRTELTLNVDYVRPWGDRGEVELGWRAERSDSDDDRLLHLFDDPEARPDGETTDRGHERRETSQSVYGTVRRGFGDLSLQAGLRLESVHLRFEVPDGDPFGRVYTNLFPSANLSWRIDDRRNVRMSYSRRVGRPGMSVLNPVDRSTDPLERRVGNPEIEPRFTHSFALHARWSVDAGSLRLSPYYTVTNDDWAEITTVDDLGVSTRTYQNVASRESWGLSLTWSLPRRGDWSGNIGVSARHENRDASNLDERYSGSSLRFSSRVNLNGRVTENLSAQANLSYSPPTDLPQGRAEARYRADFGLRYRLFDDRASVRLSLRDPFALQRASRRLRDLDYVLIGRSEESTRSARISVSWALGGGGEMRAGGGRGRR